MSDLTKIVTMFNRRYAHWSIQLPPEDIALRRRGRILQAGWTIWYLFGADEQGEYLDVYASHRMTCDRHDRLRDTGAVESLPALESFYLVADDPAETQRQADAFYAENQRIAAMLEAKGFTLDGDEPGAVSINRHLLTHPTP